MSCKDCYTGCDKVTPDKCVQYTGLDIPLLGICSGDYLSDVHKIILDKFLEIVDGTGIDLSTLDLSCQYVTDLVGNSDKNLTVLMQKLFDSQCTLKALVDQALSLEESYSFNTSCLTLPTNPSKNDILQAAITKLCSLDTRLTVIEGDYVKNSELTTLVNQIINPTTTLSVQTFSSRMVPYTAMPYFGPLSNFDNTGKGLSSVGFEKIYICNGQNSTPDMRGRVVVGAVRNIPGGTLDAAVDPTNSLNPNTNYTTGDKFGENYHKLSIGEIPQHTHSVVDPGHTHNILGIRGGDDSNNNNLQRFAGGDKNNNESGFFFTNNSACQSAQTGITISSSGSGLAHENRQPSIAAVWIMYLP